MLSETVTGARAYKQERDDCKKHASARRRSEALRGHPPRSPDATCFRPRAGPRRSAACEPLRGGGTTRRRDPLVKSSHALAVVAAACTLGCATRPLHLRDWFAVETRHFSISSSLDRSATQELASDLERFRSAVEYLQGPGTTPATTRTQVYAFDGRGFERPFDVRGARGVFLPSMRGGTLVLRTGKGWRVDATEALRHEYAHYLFRNRQGLDRPLWFDEGFGQLASTIELNDDSVWVGSVRKDHLKLLQNSLWLAGDRIVSLEDLEGLDPDERSIFQAQAWGMVQLLLLGTDSVAARRAPQRYFDAAADHGPGDLAMEIGFGVDGAELTRRLADAVRRRSFPSLLMRVRVPELREPPELRPLGLGEVLARLGWLSIRLGRPEKAAEYFGMAVAEDPRHARAHAGLGAVAKLRGEWDRAGEHFEAALDLDADDPIVQLEAAGYYQARATAEEDADGRRDWLERAREHCRRSIALDDSVAEPFAVVGIGYLLPGQPPERAREALAHAAQLQPSSLEIELLRASATARDGQPLAGRRRALNVFSRTHSPDLADAARTLADAIDRR